MKISDAILYCLWKAGGSIPHYQFQTWLKALYDAGYIDYEKVDTDELIIYKLTEKGVKKLTDNRII